MNWVSYGTEIILRTAVNSVQYFRHRQWNSVTNYKVIAFAIIVTQKTRCTNALHQLHLKLRPLTMDHQWHTKGPESGFSKFLSHPPPIPHTPEKGRR